MTMNKRYLGDSVYAERDGDRIVLTTDNGEGPTNRIDLEPEVFIALMVYVGDLRGTGESYRVIDTDKAEGGKAIVCLKCGRLSFNPNDVAARYCSNCHVFH